MKILSKLRNKRVISAIVIALALIICAVSVLSIMLPSHAEYQKYYDAVMKEKEHQKYLQSLPLEFLGISAVLAEDVVYYDNGKAMPENDDFRVTAHFTEKGKDFDEKLRSSDFEITVPDDFAENGGKITVSYTFVPEPSETKSPSAYNPILSDGESEEDTSPEPIVKTTEVDITLEAVRLAALEIVEMPYRVAYSTAMSFDKDGMSAKAKYNDGTVVSLETEDITVVTQGNLAAGATAAQVSYSDGVSSVTADVPVSVTTTADYTDGEILKLEPAGKVWLAEGSALTAATPAVRAEYENGNRLLLDPSQYTVTGNVERATFMKNCILTVSLKSDDSITRKFAANVRNGMEAEDATLEGGSTKTVEGYAYEGGELISVGSSEVVEGATKISFNISSTKVAKTNFAMRLANRTVSADGKEIVPVNISGVIGLTVNGRTVPISRSAVLSGYEIANGDEGKYVFEDFTLPDLTLNSGNNSVVLTLNLAAAGGVTPVIAIDRLDLSTVFEGEFYQSLYDSLFTSAETGADPMHNIEKINDWHNFTGGAYGHAVCSDGTYLYTVYTTWSMSNVGRKAKVVKYDPVNQKTIATSAQTDAKIFEETAGITYYDGKIILFYGDGSEVYVDASAFAEGCTFAPYDGFNFEGMEADEVLRDVYYNADLEKFAVVYGKPLNENYSSWSETLAIYNKDMTLVRKFDMPGDEGGAFKRLSGNQDYIIVNYSKDGMYTPVLRFFDWSGNGVGRFVINTRDALAADGVITNFGSTNTQGLTSIGDSLYFSVLKFSVANGGDQTALLKLSLKKIVEDKEFSLNFGEYIAACSDGTITPRFNVNPVSGAYGAVGDGTSGYSMGGCSDGEYIYVALNTTGNANTTIYKLNPSDYSTVAKSSPFSTAAPDQNAGDNSQLFIKGGKLYCIQFGNKLCSFDLSTFGNNSKPTMNATLPFDGIEGTIRGAHWSEHVGKYAVVTTANNLSILNEDGTPIGNAITLSVPRGMKAISVMGDEKYVYVSYGVNDQPNLPFDIYTWDGIKVGSGAPEGIHLRPEAPGVAAQPYNVQGIFFHDGELYSTICTWSGTTGLYLWKVGVDSSVLI